MQLIENIRARARAAKKHVVLAEGTEKRTVAAAEILTKESIAEITLLGPVSQIQAVAAENHVDLTGVNLVDPQNSPLFEDFAATFCKLREKKGMTIEKARETMKDPLYFGVMMVYQDICHGMVAGAQNATGDVLRPALQIVKTKPGISSVSGAFLMITPKTEYGEEGLLVFADCAVNPTLTAAQMRQAGAKAGHTDGLVDYAIDLEGVAMAYFARETEDGRVKVSLRALEPWRVDQVAERFGGGGHRLASGLTLDMPLAEVVRVVEGALTEALGSVNA